MTQDANAVVRRHVVVNAPIENAFATFIERFGDFKPSEQPARCPDRRGGLRSTRRRPHLRSRHRWQRILKKDARKPVLHVCRSASDWQRTT